MNGNLQLPWWEWRPAIDRLFTWGRALLRGRRYRILLNNQDRHLGWEDAWSETICLNPGQIASLVPNSGPCSREAWNLARGVLAHEVGHARFSGPYPRQALLARLTNAVEDERVERAMAADNGVLAPLFDRLGTAAHGTNAPAADDVLGILASCVAWRWEHDHPELSSLIRLSARWLTVWESEVRQRVERGWEAGSTEEVVVLAGEILEELGLDPDLSVPDGILPELDSVGGNSPDLIPDGSLHLPQVDPHERPPAQPANPPFPLASYLDLEREAQLDANRLVAQLHLDPEPERWEPAELAGRYSFRQEARTPDTPNRTLITTPNPQLALGLLVDRSGSMNTRMRGVRQAVMMILLACAQLEHVALEITAFERDERILAYGGDPEHAKPVIAGITAGGGTAMLDPLAGIVKRTAVRPESRKAVLVVHDGGPDAFEECRSLIASSPVPVWGLFITSSRTGNELKWPRQLFANRLLHGNTATLAEQLANVLKALHA